MAITSRFKKRLVLILLLTAVGVGLWPQTVLRAEIGAVRLYQVVGSPLAALVVRCHYQPSCSHYGLQVLQQDGLFWGNLKMIKRVMLCSPIGLLLDKLEETGG